MDEALLKDDLFYLYGLYRDMLVVKSIKKKYRDSVVLDNISFNIKKGEICGFLGVNGAGKSTTINIISSYLSPDSGSVELNGIGFGNYKEYRKQFGFLPEKPPIYLDMTVQEYLSFVYDAKGLPRKDKSKNINYSLEITQIGDARKRLINNLSKGFRQRIGIAQAVLGNPSILLLDEPMIGLDPLQIFQMRSMFNMLKEQFTVLMSSHILSEIFEICDRILLLSGGNIVYDGSKECFFSKDTKTSEFIITTNKSLEKSHIDAILKIKGILSVCNLDNVTYNITLKNILHENEIKKELLLFLLGQDISINELSPSLQNNDLESVFLSYICD
ncbi:MAG: ABC transporter ATP-binding protein [Clostridiaceae bacterium]|nr:ABC transporter ATP-binding protein [Clostridiaceae bacterium]